MGMLFDSEVGKLDDNVQKLLPVDFLFEIKKHYSEKNYLVKLSVVKFAIKTKSICKNRK